MPTIEKLVRSLLMFRGKRDLATVKRLKARLKEFCVRQARIASDHWDSFVTAFKCYKQLVFHSGN